MALSLHQALGLHWASPVVLRYQTADSFIRPPDDTAWREKLRRALLPAVFRTASGTQGRTVSASGAPMLSMDDDNAERTVWWRWMMPCRATAGVRPSAARAKGEHRARRPDYESLAAVRDDLEDVG